MRTKEREKRKKKIEQRGKRERNENGKRAMRTKERAMIKILYDCLSLQRYRIWFYSAKNLVVV